MRAAPWVATSLALALSGCELFRGGPVTEHGVFLPRYRTGPNEPQNGALLSGILELDRSCLWIRTRSERYLAIWPPGTTVRLEAGSTIVQTDRGSAKAGDRIQVGGGERKEIRDVRGALGQQAPSECRSGMYWVVSTDGVRAVNE